MTSEKTVNERTAMQTTIYITCSMMSHADVTSFVFRETLMSHFLLWGNAYAQILRDGRGNVLSLYPLLPNRSGNAHELLSLRKV